MANIPPSDKKFNQWKAETILSLKLLNWVYARFLSKLTLSVKNYNYSIIHWHITTNNKKRHIQNFKTIDRFALINIGQTDVLVAEDLMSLGITHSFGILYSVIWRKLTNIVLYISFIFINRNLNANLTRIKRKYRHILISSIFHGSNLNKPDHFLCCDILIVRSWIIALFWLHALYLFLLLMDASFFCVKNNFQNLQMLLGSMDIDRA